MHDLTGRVTSIALSYATRKPLVTMEFDEDKETLLQIFEELKAQDGLTIKIGKKSKKRSLDANAYAWVLLGKLAAKVGKPRTEIYREYIRDLGDNSDTVCVQDKAVESLCKGWEHNGIGWQTDTFPSKIEGCTNVILYYGSSTYDTPTMARLINNIVEDCKTQGIETRCQEDLDSLLKTWRESR